MHIRFNARPQMLAKGRRFSTICHTAGFNALTHYTLLTDIGTAQGIQVAVADVMPTVCAGAANTAGCHGDQGRRASPNNGLAIGPGICSLGDGCPGYTGALGQGMVFESYPAVWIWID